MLEPSKERIILEPIPRVLPGDFRIASSTDAGTEVRVGGPWLLLLTLICALLALVAIFGIAQRAPALTVAGWVIATALLLLALLRFGDEGAALTRVWRFAPGRISREGRLPLPVLLFRREFPDVEEFEIVHAVWTKGIFSRRLHGGHQDALRFRARGLHEPVTIIVRARSVSGANLWGGLFTQDRASEIEREILPEVLSVAGLASRMVGVPVYVMEKTAYVGSDMDG